MTCPYCLKEIDDKASFCSYCGESIIKPKTETVIELQKDEVKQDTEKSIEKEELPDTASINENNTQVIDDAVTEEKTGETKKNKLGTKILIIISIIAIVAGAILGFLTARGTIDILSIFRSERAEWSDFSEGVKADDNTSENDSDNDKKDSDADEQETESKEDSSILEENSSENENNANI